MLFLELAVTNQEWDFFPTVGLKGGNKEEEKGKEGLPLLFALLVCACVYANGRADVYVHIGCKRMYEQPF